MNKPKNISNQFFQGNNQAELNANKLPWGWLITAILYFLSPVDIIPDVIVGAGQVDDIFTLVTAGLTVYQAYIGKSNQDLARIVWLVKIGIITVGVLIVSIMALIVVGIAAIIHAF